MKFKPENGMKVWFRGEISVYEPSGQYQIYIKEMKPDGVGELFLAYEQLKAKIGLQKVYFARKIKSCFQNTRKRSESLLHQQVLRSEIFLSTIKRRYPIAKILVLPALVQGDQAAPSIVKAIELGK